MGPKRQRVQEASTSQARSGQAPRTRGNNSNPHGIVFRDSYQRIRYSVLVTRKMVNTRYLDEGVLATLGLLDDVNWMLENVGWTNFAAMKYPAYESLTLEFLSSVDANVLHGSGSEEGSISFRLFNREHQLNLAQLNAIFGLPCGGERRTPNDFNDSQFWFALTNETNYVASRAKATYIRNPCFRYVQRLMANTVFGRGDSDGVVRQSELLFMWAMLHNVDLDTGSHLVRQFTKVAKAAAGNIVIGGLITPIALALDYDLSGLKEATGGTRIDMETCIAIRMIVREDDHYCLVLRDSVRGYPLPDPEHTTVRRRENWNFPLGPPPEHLFVERPIRQSMPGPSSSQPQSDSYSHSQASLSTLEAEQARHGAILEQLQQQGRNTDLRLEHMDLRLHNVEGMVQAIYNWHLSQGHFPPSA